MASFMSFDEFRQMISDNLGIAINRLEKDTSFFGDLGIDSLSLVNFIVKVEKHLEIRFNLENLWKIKNIEEAYNIFVESLNMKEQ